MFIAGAGLHAAITSDTVSENFKRTLNFKQPLWIVNTKLHSLSLRSFLDNQSLIWTMSSFNKSSKAVGENMSWYYGKIMSFIFLTLSILSTLVVFKECESLSLRDGFFTSLLIAKSLINPLCCVIFLLPKPHPIDWQNTLRLFLCHCFLTQRQKL